MGNYGYGPFDSDVAFDWVGSLVLKKPAASWKSIREVASYAHVPTGSGIEELYAAGEVVAWVKGRGKHPPKEHPGFEVWLNKQGKRLPAGLSQLLVEKLSEAAKAARAGTWKRNVSDLVRRLRLR